MLPIFLCLMQSVKAPNGALRFCLALDKASRSIRPLNSRLMGLWRGKIFPSAPPQLPPEGTEGVGRFFPSVRSNFRLMFLWGGDFLCRPIPLDGTVGDGLNKKTRAFVEMKINAAGRFCLL